MYLIFLLFTTGFYGILIFDQSNNTYSVKAKTIYVDIGGFGDFTTIQDAIISANDGDTIFVANGTYHGSVTINKNNISLMGNSSLDCRIIHDFVGTNDVNNYAAAINVTASGVYISGFNITTTGNYTSGIRLKDKNASRSTIAKNKITTSGSWAYGIYFIDSIENNITENNISTGIRSYGIQFKNSLNNSITKNKITSREYLSIGIFLDSTSWFNNITDNTIMTNGQYAHGVYLNEPKKNKIMNNDIELLGSGSVGIYLSRSSDNQISSNSIVTVGSSGLGVYLNTNCIYNEITNNTIKTSGVEADGFYIRAASNYNNLTSNKITTHGQNSECIYILDSVNINLIKNEISNLGDGYGIYFYKGISLNLSGNILIGGGIMLYGPWLYNWDSHKIDNANTINGKPVRYYTNTQNVVVPGTIGEVIMVNCSNFTISDKSFTDGGVIEAFSNNSLIKNSKFESCSIFITSTSNTNIINNTFTNASHSDYSGNSIYIGPYSSKNKVLTNKISLLTGYAIACYSDGCNISYNKVMNMNGTGISAQYCSNIDIEYNTITTSGNTGFGIDLWSTDNNKIRFNKLTIQNTRGIYLRSASNYNNILNNEITIKNDNGYAIDLESISFCRIENNTINTEGYRGYGIRLDGAASINNIKNNQISTNGERAYGICLYNDGYHTQNVLVNNSVTTYGQRGYGIYLYQTSGNLLTSNIINTFGLRGDGLYLQEALVNKITSNQITTSDGGYGIFIIQGSDNNDLRKNLVNTSGDEGYGIIIRNSDETIVNRCDIVTSGVNAHGLYLDKNYAEIVNSTITTGTNSYDIYAINNSAITAINTSFNNIQVAELGGCLLKVKNYLDIKIYNEDGLEPVSNADVRILDNNKYLYFSSGFGGTDPATNMTGSINTTLVTDRWYLNNNNAKENTTQVSVKKTIDYLWQETRANVDMSNSHTEIFYTSDIIAPAIPKNLTAEPVLGKDELQIKWDLNDDNNDTKFYDLWWRDPILSSWMPLVEIEQTMDEFNFTDERLINGSKYTFKLRALDEVRNPSLFTEPVTVVHRDYIPPIKPTEITAVAISENEIGLTWNQSISSDVVGYKIYMNHTESDGINNSYYFSLIAIVDAETKYYEAGGLTENTRYYFVISSFDEANNTSPYSDEVNATTKKQTILIIPYVKNEIPKNNSINVPINVSVLITFNTPMNTNSITNVLTIIPEVEYELGWSDNKTELYINFIQKLSYNTSYLITIGRVLSDRGLPLKSWPYLLKFTTEQKPEIKPPDIVLNLSISSPRPNAVIEVNHTISVSGTSTGFKEGFIVNVNLVEKTETCVINPDGSWSVLIRAPGVEGNYTIKVIAGNITRYVSIIVKDTYIPDKNGDEPKDGDIDTDNKVDNGLIGLGVLMDYIIFLLIILLIVIVFLILLIRKGRSLKMPDLEEEEIEE